MVLLLPSLTSLFSQLTSPSASPHTALLLSRPSGSVLVSHSTASEPPWPELPWIDQSEEERAATFAAVASSSYESRIDESVELEDDDEQDGFRLETEFGRISMLGIGSFLLVLVASPITPWAVLEKKLKAAEEVLRIPLEKISVSSSGAGGGGGVGRD